MVKEKEAISVNIDFNARIHNRFDIEVRDAKTGELKQKAQAFNVICDALWPIIVNINGYPYPNRYFNYIHYGRGSGTPSASDTQLFSIISSAEVTDPIYSYSHGVISLTKKIVIGTETSNGETITEVGIGQWASGRLVTHAMLQDMNGNPVSILKTNTDIITIYATVYLHYSSQSSHIYLYSNYLNESNGVKYPSTFFMALLGSIPEGIGGFTDISPYNCEDENFDETGSITASGTFTPSSATKSFSVQQRLNVSDGNVSKGLKKLSYGMTGGYCNYFCIIDYKAFNLNSYAISGESVGTGDGSKTEFDTKFWIGSGAKVYVDGVEQASGVTIHTGASKDFYNKVDFGQIFNTDHELVPYPKNVANRTFVFGNPSGYEYTGLSFSEVHIYGYYSYGVTFYIYSSNDFENWTLFETLTFNTEGSNAGVFQTPISSKFIKVAVEPITGTKINCFALTSSRDFDHNIVFDNPPSAGAAITVDYVPDCIPKDTNHVFDVNLTITLGEYVGN